MTLVEVMAGIALLGTLLVAMLLAEGRCKRQTAFARQRLAAVQAAQGLLEEWWVEPSKLPRRDHGTCTSAPFGWRTSTVESPAAEQLKLEVVRLELRPLKDPQERPVVSVDVVLPRQVEP